MSPTTGRILNRKSFTALPPPQDVINGVHCIARRNPKGIDIGDRDWRPFLDPEDRANEDRDDFTYAFSDNDSSDNEYESENNQSNHNNLHPHPDQ